MSKKSMQAKIALFASAQRETPQNKLR